MTALTEELEQSRGGIRDQLKEKDAKINTLVEELGNSQAMLNDKVAELAEVGLGHHSSSCKSLCHPCKLSLASWTCMFCIPAVYVHTQNSMSILKIAHFKKQLFLPVLRCVFT